MSRDEMIRRGLEAFEAAKKQSPEDWFQMMIDKGILDSNHEVIFVHGDKQQHDEQEEQKEEPPTSR